MRQLGDGIETLVHHRKSPGQCPSQEKSLFSGAALTQRLPWYVASEAGDESSKSQLFDTRRKPLHVQTKVLMKCFYTLLFQPSKDPFWRAVALRDAQRLLCQVPPHYMLQHLAVERTQARLCPF